jgi:hypothetical protein
MESNSLPFKALEFYGTKIHHPGQWRVHRYLRNLLRADIDRDLEVTRRGLKWLLNPSDYMQSDFFWLGSLEGWDTYHALKLLRPQSVIFDIGANFGYYSMILSAALQGHCQVFAFEPNPPTFSRLTKNIALNDLHGRIKAFQFALSDRSGSARISGPPGNSGAAHIVTDSTDTQVTSHYDDARRVLRYPSFW